MPRQSLVRQRAPLLLAAALILCARSHAADAPPAAELQHVEVSAREQPMEQKSYRDLLAAMKRFEPYQAAHPDARLRFRIWQRKDGIDISQLRVWIHDPVDFHRVEPALAADGSFTVPVLADLREHDAVVRTNMPEGTLAWKVAVTRAGDDERHHVMGDLREACLLDVDFAHLARAIKPPAIYALDAVSSNICTVRGVDWGFYAERPVFSAHMSTGDRRVALLSDRLHAAQAPPVLYPLVDWAYVLRDRFYSPPLNDSSWPDDATVDLVYVDDPDDVAASASNTPKPATP